MIRAVAGTERKRDRARRLAREALMQIGNEIRQARLAAGLSQSALAKAAGISQTRLSRIERGKALNVPHGVMAEVCAAVGLDLSLRAFPGGSPMRDRAHEELLARLRAIASPTWRWRSEVPLPIPGDRRAWDRLLDGAGVSIAIEAETRPRDLQELLRRIALKRRDSGVDRVILLLRNTRWNRDLARSHSRELVESFPINGTTAMEALRAGRDPGGHAVILL